MGPLGLSATVGFPSTFIENQKMMSDSTIDSSTLSKRGVSDAGADGPEMEKVSWDEAPSGGSVNKPSEVGTASYTDNDVLSGRGGGTNLHDGNRLYRDLILSHRETYESTSKTKKPGVARKIVQIIRDQGGRFLRREKDGLYYDIGDEKARAKTCQALRHRTMEKKDKDDPLRKKVKGPTSKKKKVGKGAESQSGPKASSGGAKEASSHQQSEPDLSHGSPRATSPSENTIPSPKDFSLAESPSIDLQRPAGMLATLPYPPHNTNAEPIVQDQVYRESFLRQRELLEARQQNMNAMLALRQREAMLDRAMVNEAQMRRFLALNSGFSPSGPQLTNCFPPAATQMSNGFHTVAPQIPNGFHPSGPSLGNGFSQSGPHLGNGFSPAGLQFPGAFHPTSPQLPNGFHQTGPPLPHGLVQSAMLGGGQANPDGINSSVFPQIQPSECQSGE